jgi:hypothetical protein
MYDQGHYGTRVFNKPLNNCTYCNNEYGIGKYCDHYHSGTPTAMHPAVLNPKQYFDDFIKMNNTNSKQINVIDTVNNIKFLDKIFIALCFIVLLFVIISTNLL